jgi:hypothetical protein
VGKVKYFIILALVFITCCSKSGVLEQDETYFKSMNQILDQFEQPINKLADAFDVYIQDPSKKKQLYDAANVVYEETTKDLKKVKAIKPVPGWGGNHESIIKSLTDFQDFAREAVRMYSSKEDQIPYEVYKYFTDGLNTYSITAPEYRKYREED